MFATLAGTKHGADQTREGNVDHWSNFPVIALVPCLRPFISGIYFGGVMRVLGGRFFTRGMGAQKVAKGLHPFGFIGDYL